MFQLTKKTVFHLLLVLYYKYTCGRVILHTLGHSNHRHCSAFQLNVQLVFSSPKAFLGFEFTMSSFQWLWIMKRLPATTLFQSSPSVEIVIACSPGCTVLHCLSSARVSRCLLLLFCFLLLRLSVHVNWVSSLKHTRCKTWRSIMTSCHFMTSERTRWHHLYKDWRNLSDGWLFQWLS